MPIRLDGLTRRYGVGRGARRPGPRHRRRRVPRAARPLGLRQDDGAAGDRRLRPARRRPGAARRPRHHRRAGEQAGHGHGVPGLQPLPEPHGGRERGLRPAGPAAPARPSSAPVPPSCWSWSGWPTAATATRTSSRVASSSGWRWPARWPWRRRCCCSTSRCPRSTRRCGCSCARRSAGSSSSSASRPSSSRTTRPRRCRSPTGSGVMRSGRLEQVASPDELYERPATAFVAEFVGTMNRLPASLATARSSCSASAGRSPAPPRRRAGRGAGPARGAGGEGRPAGRPGGDPHVLRRLDPRARGPRRRRRGAGRRPSATSGDLTPGTAVPVERRAWRPGRPAGRRSVGVVLVHVAHRLRAGAGPGDDPRPASGQSGRPMSAAPSSPPPVAARRAGTCAVCPHAGRPRPHLAALLPTPPRRAPRPAGASAPPDAAVRDHAG